MIPGIDVSENNGTVNWKAVASAGYKFAFIKAIEGATYHDKQFVTNYAQAKSLGIFRGAYGFARPGTSTALDEATALVNVVEANGGFELPPMLDMEDAGGLGSNALIQWCRIWAGYVSSKTNRKPILYVGSSFIKQYGLHAMANQFDLFVADYGVDKPDIGNFASWKFWQKSQNGTVTGASGAFDIDVFNGSLTELQNLCPDPPKPLPELKYRVVTNTFDDVDKASQAAMQISQLGYVAEVVQA